MTMTDFQLLTNTKWCVQPDGTHWRVPFDANLDSMDLLSLKLLEYFDFLVAHTPFNSNTTSTNTSLGLDTEITGLMCRCSKEHRSYENVLAMGTMVNYYYGKCGSILA